MAATAPAAAEPGDRPCDIYKYYDIKSVWVKCYTGGAYVAIAYCHTYPVGPNGIVYYYYNYGYWENLPYMSIAGCYSGDTLVDGYWGLEDPR